MSSLTAILESPEWAGLRADSSLRHEHIPGFIAPIEEFAEVGRRLKKEEARLVAEWASDDTAFERGFAVHASYAKKKEYVILTSYLKAGTFTFPSLSKHFVAASRFERTIHSLMGLTPGGLSDKRPWIKHEDWPEDAFPLRKTFDAAQKMPRIDGDYAWVRAEGDGVYEIPVGPVHAGIIEPGHFRFQALGEDILNLEERLGYVHKGIEKRFESLSWYEGARLAARVSGDTTVAHSTAYCRALEALCGCEPPARANWLRAIMLERERIANHLGDIGAICNDAAFAFFNYQFSRLRETILRTNKTIFGHRLMMDGVIPGGVTADLNAKDITSIKDELKGILAEFELLALIYIDNPSLGNRVYGTGFLSRETAVELGCVGIVARASNVPIDARISMPYPPYDTLPPDIRTEKTGDVHGRIMVRIEEVRESVRLIKSMLSGLPEGTLKKPIKNPEPDKKGFALVEGWRGEIVYWLHSGPEGEINRCMVRGPSAVNWLALESAIKCNLVPDFPLCNKSFNQSYSGNDL
ncbi:MAG: NADH-quinone oxidoreductase subunit C [Thermodesulfobacteriota bacterium]